MDVFVIPISSDRYELYCEPTVDSVQDDGGDAPQRLTRWWHLDWWRLDQWRRRLASMTRRSASMLKAVEQRQHRPAGESDEPRGWMARQQDRMLAWVAERIAEQRLLWNLRGQTAAVAVFPQDMTFEQVMTLVRRKLQRDYERHRLWLIVDTIGLILSWPLVFVPGPNVLLYYFMLRVGGHWFSMRGARQGLDRIAWTGRPCPPLAELRDVAALDPATRERRVHDIATRLRLQNLSRFYDRVAI